MWAALGAILDLNDAIADAICQPRVSKIGCKGLAKHVTKENIVKAVAEIIRMYGPDCPYTITVKCAIMGDDAMLTITTTKPADNPADNPAAEKRKTSGDPAKARSDPKRARVD